MAHHDLSHYLRTSMAPGLGYPICCIPCNPGDHHQLEFKHLMNTQAILNPLYGSYRLQICVFFAGVSLYVPKLWRNGSLLQSNTGLLDVKDQELTQVQIYKFFTFVQKKNNYFTNFIIFIKHLEGSRGRTLRLSYLASRARTHAKRARTRTACRQSHPRGPLTPLQTSLVTRRCASHRYLYRVFMARR